MSMSRPSSGAPIPPNKPSRGAPRKAWAAYRRAYRQYQRASRQWQRTQRVRARQAAKQTRAELRNDPEVIAARGEKVATVMGAVTGAVKDVAGMAGGAMGLPVGGGQPDAADVKRAEAPRPGVAPVPITLDAQLQKKPLPLPLIAGGLGAAGLALYAMRSGK